MMRASPLAFAFGILVLLPFAIVCCHSSSSSSGVVPIDNGTRLVPTPDENPSPTIASVDAGAPAIADSASATATTPATPKAKCEQIRRSMSALINRSLDCSTDEDCIDLFTPCGLPGMCGIPIAATAKSKIEAAEKPWKDQGCVAIMASPCATCMKPPTPSCYHGKCSN